MSSTGTTASKNWAHIKMIWSGKDPITARLVLLERAALLALCFGMYVTPGFWIRHVGGLWGRRARKAWIDVYAVAKLTLVMFVLYSNWWKHWWVPYVAFYLIADVFISLAGYVFLRKFWQYPYSWGRSVMLLFINFLEYSCWFACIYLSWGLLRINDPASNLTVQVFNWSDAFYFSVVTAATVGFGDISPSSVSGRRLVTLEILLSLFFMATVVAYFVSNIGREEKDKPE